MTIINVLALQFGLGFTLKFNEEYGLQPGYVGSNNTEVQLRDAEGEDDEGTAPFWCRWTCPSANRRRKSSFKSCELRRNNGASAAVTLHQNMAAAITGLGITNFPSNRQVPPCGHAVLPHGGLCAIKDNADLSALIVGQGYCGTTGAELILCGCLASGASAGVNTGALVANCGVAADIAHDGADDHLIRCEDGKYVIKFYTAHGTAPNAAPTHSNNVNGRKKNGLTILWTYAR